MWGTQVPNKVFTSTAHASLFCSEPKIESWRWSRDVLSLQGMSCIRPPSLCVFSPAGFLPQRSSRADSAVATEGPAKRSARVILSSLNSVAAAFLFSSALRSSWCCACRNQEFSAPPLCTGDVWSWGSARGRRKMFGARGCEKKSAPPPSANVDGERRDESAPMATR